ncbi:DUF6157 family protein [Pedobacter aquatilis]|uniref:DUF6157 family protein n=1 Tax=Pedobacter aquatilis TaxID=351343 RepID=UPI0025B2CDDF|nr:DUF6157 family protein [Pedobacter aquatilis]MDN3587486.1 DUF6157 family protein [Pedobacter aquatilis]
MGDKIHTTNYYNTFIEIAGDSKAEAAIIPKSKGKGKTVAEMQFELISKNPYKFTSDDVLFCVYAERNDIAKTEQNAERTKFFSKGQACLRASPLTKKYGFGLHSDMDGKIALYGVETEKYHQFLTNPDVKKVKAMRSAKK